MRDFRVDKEDWLKIGLIIGVVSLGVFLGLHGYRLYMNQFVGFCVNSSGECMVPVIG